MSFMRTISGRTAAVLAALVLSGTFLFAQEDSRIKDELSSSKQVNPLKQALGEKAYNKAIRSGKYYYVGNTKCRLCHRKFFLGRKKDPHDYAMKSLKKGGYEDNAKCLPCHSTGYGVPNGFVSKKETPRLSNVQCEGCHGPGNRHVKIARKTKKGGGFLAGTDKPKILKKMCKSCHTERWNRAYKDFHAAYSKYKNADPNKKAKAKIAKK